MLAAGMWCCRKWPTSSCRATCWSSCMSRWDWAKHLLQLSDAFRLSKDVPDNAAGMPSMQRQVLEHTGRRWCSR